MQYREFGKTGLKLSILGYGAMRLPPPDNWHFTDMQQAVPLMQRAMDLGVNYIDTAHVYPMSEQAVGLAIKGRRDKVIISTKNPVKENDPKRWRATLDESLRRLGIDRIDVLHLHDMSAVCFANVFQRDGLLKTVRKAQSEGLFTHLAFSCHDQPQNIIKLIQTGEFVSMLVQYNYLDRRNEEAIALASQRGMGVAIMGPVAGGRLVGPGEHRAVADDLKVSPAAIALRFVLDNPDVDVTLSGMSAMDQVEENCATAADFAGLTRAELARIEQLIQQKKGLADLYCTGCGYCMPCPNGVDIPGVFLLRNYKAIYLHGPAGFQYNKLRAEGKGAEACAECGECEEKCPQHIQIASQLKEAHETLTGKPIEKK